jgi:hypothetical protein
MAQETNQIRISINDKDEVIFLSKKGKSVSYGDKELLMHDFHLKSKSGFEKFYSQNREIFSTVSAKMMDKGESYLNGVDESNLTFEDLMKEAIFLYNYMIFEIINGIEKKQNIKILCIDGMKYNREHCIVNL